jgi:peptidoglycan/LPS O-acetylase OafA/YrhL
METLVWMFVVGAIAAAGVGGGVKRRSVRLGGSLVVIGIVLAVLMLFTPDSCSETVRAVKPIDS